MVEANCLGLQEFRTTGNHAKIGLKNVRTDCTVEIMMIEDPKTAVGERSLLLRAPH